MHLLMSSQLMTLIRSCLVIGQYSSLSLRFQICIMYRSYPPPAFLRDSYFESHCEVIRVTVLAREDLKNERSSNNTFSPFFYQISFCEYGTTLLIFSTSISAFKPIFDADYRIFFNSLSYFYTSDDFSSIRPHFLTKASCTSLLEQFWVHSARDQYQQSITYFRT